MHEVLEMIRSLVQDFDMIKAYVLELKRPETNLFKEQWIDGQDVLQVLHISKRNLQTLRDNGTLGFSRIGGKIYYKVSDVEGLLEKNYSPSK